MPSQGVFCNASGPADKFGLIVMHDPATVPRRFEKFSVQDFSARDQWDAKKITSVGSCHRNERIVRQRDVEPLNRKNRRYRPCQTCWQIVIETDKKFVGVDEKQPVWRMVTDERAEDRAVDLHVLTEIGAERRACKRCRTSVRQSVDNILSPVN